MEAYRLVQAEWQDAELIAPLFNDYRVFYGKQPDSAGALQFIQERLRAEESVLFMALKDEAGSSQAGGFVQLYPSFSSVTMQRLWILNDLYVAEHLRGLGLGKLLLEGVREYAVNRGSKGLTLTTMTDNIRAQRLYEAQGYIRDEEFYTYDLIFK
ncbi:GNAT family N-acetyltransferase [Paenibacillus camerounensis]|uniref:GNAT family N-acetyltransferase n=1 Tax=Paenibacillus camerounensis TaxID=1243663 RepID=UPI0005A5F5F5|nr:GNAT family N-acetyltransferase [Paenibacillus camerounensis]